ncbi:MAG: hypothetical protein QME52_10555 [Bacteroidota bacterium]|nr:hypothetical protein [Bacteroidota bacterium]
MDIQNVEKYRLSRRRLLAYLRRNGCVRFPNLKIQKSFGQNKYKKGWEVRLVAKTKDELYLIRQYLDDVGLKKGKPFKKGEQTIQPIYGKQAFNWFKTH